MKLICFGAESMTGAHALKCFFLQDMRAPRKISDHLV